MSSSSQSNLVTRRNLLAMTLPMLGAVALIGCGDDAPKEGAAVQSQQVETQGVDQMKKFMESQKGGGGAAPAAPAAPAK